MTLDLQSQQKQRNTCCLNKSRNINKQTTPRTYFKQVKFPNIPPHHCTLTIKSKTTVKTHKPIRRVRNCKLNRKQKPAKRVTLLTHAHQTNQILNQKFLLESDATRSRTVANKILRHLTRKINKQTTPHREKQEGRQKVLLQAYAYFENQQNLRHRSHHKNTGC